MMSYFPSLSSLMRLPDYLISRKMSREIHQPGGSQMKWETVHSMGARTRFGQNKINELLLLSHQFIETPWLFDFKKNLTRNPPPSGVLRWNKRPSTVWRPKLGLGKTKSKIIIILLFAITLWTVNYLSGW